MKDIKETVGELSVDKLRALSHALAALQGERRECEIKPRGAQVNVIPLSLAQERLWFLEQFEPLGSAYNNPMVLELEGALDQAALERSFAELVRRHESLRTRIETTEDGQGRQVIDPAGGFRMGVVDLSSWPEAGRRAKAVWLAQAEAAQPFDLSRELFRVWLYRLSAEEHLLLVMLHHIMSDGWSESVLVRELGILYTAYQEGRSSPLPELEVQYADYALWQREWLQGEILERQVAYWKERLRGIPAALELPTDRPRPATFSYKGARHPLALSKELTARLEALGRREGATLYMVLLAALQVLLSRWSGQDDIAVGSPIAGRTRQKTEGLIGFFINTLVMRTDLSGDPTFVELLKRVRSVTLGAYTHQDLPFEKLVAELQPERDLSRQALVQVGFILQNMPLSSSGLPGLLGRRVPLPSTTSKFDLAIEFFEVGSGLEGSVEYATDLFDRATIERFAGNFQTLLEAVVEEADRPISELPLLSEAERRLLLEEWNETIRDYPKEKCIHHLFEEQVGKTPDAAAVISEDAWLSYDELNRRANHLAHHLRRLGVRPEVVVGICVERTLEMIVGLLGILKAGGAYLPLDPGYPVERLRYMLEDTETPVVVTQGELKELLSFYGGEKVCVDQEWEAIGRESEGEVGGAVRAENLAYVIYTSGSTGEPKGVTIQHRSLCSLAKAQELRFGLNSSDHVLLFSSLNFDASVWEMVMAFSKGAKLYLAAEEIRLSSSKLIEMLHNQAITVATIPPSLLALTSGDEIPEFHTVITGGEACPAEAVAHWGSGRRFFNVYGPTETTCAVTAMECSRDKQGPPIGRPMANSQIYILDERLQPVPIGVAGEIHIGGAGLARGYRKRPDQTAERFVPNPFGEAGSRLYRTGDLGCWLADGTIEFLGRNDFQVKIRGFRIELGEIEARLAEHAGVGQAVVVMREDAAGDKRLVAYYTCAEEIESGVGVEELRSHLSARLPEYMAPATFIFLAELPLNPNGKVDRKALPAPEAGAYGVRGYEAPVGEIEIRLARIWAEILKLERVGRHDNFFELGGHSLLALTLNERMRREGFLTNGRTIFTSSTLKALAEAVAGGAEKEIEAPPNLIPAGCQVITPEMLPLIALTQAEIDGIAAGVPGGAANIKDIYPLAPLQEGILFHHLMSVQGDAYLVSCLLAFDTRQQLDNFVGALSAVIARHDILRTAVVWEGLPEPAQVVWREAPLAIEEVAMDSSVDVASRLRASFDPRIIRLDVRRAPLMRCVIAHDAANDRWLMLWLSHHLAVDHTTLEIMALEAQAFLQGESERLPAPLPFRNFVAQARLGVSRSEHEAFFREMLGGVEEPTAPFGLLDAKGDGSGIQDARLELGAALSSRLRERARRLGVSAASLCHLAWAQVLARVSGREDVVFGTILFGRMQGGEGADRTLGLFINTLPVRIQVGAEGVERSARRTHELLAGLMRHEHASLALAQRCSAVAAPTPLFSSVFNYRYSPRPAEAAQARVGIEVLESEERTNYPVTLSVDDLSDDFLLTAQTVTSINPIRICDLMRAALERLVKALETAPETAAAAIDVLPEAERHRLLIEWNATETDYPKEKCVHQLFEEQAERTPRAVAVVHGERRLTYAELNARVNRLAWRLLGMGVEPGSRVALLLERSIELVVAQLAVLKCGAVYVPIDPTFPGERQVFMVDDCAASAVITSKNTVLPEGLLTPRIDVDEVRQTKGRKENPNLDADSRMAAYVMYTSGSTGRPKGVVVTHRAIGRLVLNCGYADFNESDRVAFAANPAFDAATMEIWAPLLNGGRIVVVDREAFLEPRRFAQLLERQGVTALFLTTAIFDQYAQAIPEALARLRHLFSGGEKNDPTSFSRVLEQSGPQHLVHCYGPTETTTYATTHEVREVAAGTRSIPLGRPISNTQIYILDANQQPTPIGVTGELYIGGAGVALGYLNRPELTAERFLTDPFTEQIGARMYKSGDLGCWLAGGTIEFLGRNDFQVKIRGFRIELGEIEARLAEHTGVGQAVVVMREDTAEDKRLVAYYTCVEETESGVVAEDLRSHLSSRLPEYMVPAAYVRMERFPLTPNGKLDRKALPAPEGGAYVARRYGAPVGEIETALAMMWAELLGVEEVGRHDNLFELGGHSVLALRLISRLRKKLGVEVTVNELFANPVLRDFARVVEGAARTTLPEIGIAERGAPLPLSFAQQRLWFLAQMGGASQAYNFWWGMRLRGELNRGALRRALDRIVERHEALRTSFVLVGGEVAQSIAAIGESRFQLVEQDLRQPGNGQEELDELIKQEERAAFDLQAGPLIRGRLIRLGENEHTLLITMHHIVSDGWSIGLLLNELSALYGAYLRGEADPLPPLSVQYADYAVWQRKWIEGGILQRQIGYWKEALAGAPGLLELPADHHRPATQNYAGASTGLELDEKLVSGLKELSRRHETTLFMTLLGGWAALMARLSGQEDIVIGTPMANRGRIEIEKQIGFFVNTLAMRINASASSTVGELLDRVKARTLRAQQHQDVPFERVVEVLRPERNLSHSPIFQVAFVWQNAVYLEGALELPGLEVKSLPNAPQATAKFDLTLALWEGAAGKTIVGWLEYATSLFEAATIERYLGYFRTLLEGMVADDSQAVDRLPLLSASERHQVVEQWNETAVDYPAAGSRREKLVHKLFEEQVKRTPEAVAVAFEDRQLTYAELNKKANRLAHYLQTLGVGPEARVGICLERSLEIVIGLLGILKAGGAYVPLDAAYPVERKALLMTDSGVKIVLSTSAMELPETPLVARINLDQTTALVEGEAVDPCEALGGEALAYVMYTSGSTGKPKGIMTPHRAIGRTVLNCGYAEFNESDRVAFAANPAFDAATMEIWAPLLNGGRMVVVDQGCLLEPSRLAQILKQQGVSVLWLTAGLFHQSARSLAEAFGGLRYLIAGGDVLDPRVIAQVLRDSPPRHLVNGYGPTETTTFAITHEIKEVSESASSIPIGRPISNTQIYILDANLQPTPIGVTGELYIGGAGVALGYLNRPELTAERFLNDPFTEQTGARMYKTGDLGRWLADGTIEFLGRNDFQVKIRGFRVELGEVEARLAEHAGVGQAVVVMREDAAGDKRLVTYYTCVEEAERGVVAEELRSHLSAKLPAYMVPAAYVRMERFPLTPNGKLDRRALPAPEGDAYVARKYEAPVGETETALASIWAEMLGVEEVGRHDNFFELGGHSLLGMRLISRLRQTLGVEVSISDLFAQTNLASFAEHVINLQLEQFDPNKLADVLSLMRASNVG